MLKGLYIPKSKSTNQTDTLKVSATKVDLTKARTDSSGITESVDDQNYQNTVVYNNKLKNKSKKPRKPIGR